MNADNTPEGWLPSPDIVRATDEVWRPVVGHEGLYEVSSIGRVRSTPRPGWRGCVFHNGRFRILAQTLGGRRNNYYRVRLHTPARHAYVHHLLAEAFIGPRPDGCHVLHGNEGSLRNLVSNIRYGDEEENHMDNYVTRVGKRLPKAPF